MFVLTIFSLIVLLLSIIIHEIAHGSVALYLGDTTAKREGRLTLNPLKHLDPFGSIILPLLLFISGSSILIGWAKPVPINPYNFKDQKWGVLKVAIAGPATNLSLAIVFGLLIRFFVLPGPLSEFFLIVIFYNSLLALFNLIPLFPLDGSHILLALMPQKWIKFRMLMHQYGLLILILFIFSGIGGYILYSATSFVFYLISGNKII